MSSYISIYNWSSGISGNNATGIAGLTKEDRVYYKNFNRPLKKLYDNDQSIVKSIDKSVITNKLYTDEIDTRNSSTLIINTNINIYGSILISGLTAVILSSQLTIKDNVITLNDGNTMSNDGIGGIEVDRGSSLSKATLLYKEADKKWHFSGSGITGDSVNVGNIEASYITLNKRESVITPDSGKINVYVNQDGKLAYKNENGDIALIENKFSKYDIYIYNNSTFEDYFGSENLTGSGLTSGGWSYKNTGNYVSVVTPSNKNVLINNGQYRLSTKVKLSNGFNLVGNNEKDTLINIVNDSVMFSGNETFTQNIRLKDFTIRSSNIGTLINRNLFQIDNFSDSEFYNTVESVLASGIYGANNNTNNVHFGDVKNSSAIIFNGISFGKIEGKYINNSQDTLSNVTDTILNAVIIGSDLYTGIGNWDL